MSIASEISRIQNNIASAYTACENKGATLPQTQNSANLANAISNIPASSASLNPTAEPNDVEFIDYDGTIRYSYSASDFANLSALPDNPTHEGLIAQGWNWTLADAKSYVANYGSLNIGQMYITDDGVTRLYIYVSEERKKVGLTFQQSVKRGVEVDWGDRSAIGTWTGTSTPITNYHTYSKGGIYVIKLKPLNSCVLTIGGGTSQCCISAGYGVINTPYTNMLSKVEIGENTVIGQYAFCLCYNLKEITIPQHIQTINNNTFAQCTSLSNIIIPKLVTNIGNQVFSGCYSLSFLIIPNNIATIGTYAFNNCYSLTKFVVSKDVANIPASAFTNCCCMKIYDFSQHTQVPTLANTNAFTNIPNDCQIIVPDDLYDTWIAATNWSTYASKIVKASEV